jgi:predicted AlkP superfamily pyrophosphatase or phosphodiesterase
MLDLTESCLEKIKAKRISQLDFNQDFIFPNYSGFSVANLPASIFSWLGTTLHGSTPLSAELINPLNEQYEQVILLLVDSLGLALFNRLLMRIVEQGKYSLWYPLLDSSVVGAISSVTPSTTATILTSLWTGKEPGEHGVIGYELWLKEYGIIANMIAHSLASSPDEVGSLTQFGFNPNNFLSVECIGPKLKNQGIATGVFQHVSIADSGLSNMLMQDTTIFPWRTFEELWQTVSAAFKRAPGKSYSHVYWGDLDTLSHRYGPGHEFVWKAWLDFSNQLGQFLVKIKTTSNVRTLFLLTADHGQIPQIINPDYEIKKHPQLMENLKMLPSGESRLPYLFVREGREKEIKDYIEHAWPGKFRVITSREFIGSGALGNSLPCQSSVDRLGDLVVIPTGNDYLRWASKENHMLGRHGAFLPEEMLVPFLAIML